MLKCDKASVSGLFEVIGEVVVEGDCVTRTYCSQFRLATLSTSEATVKFIESLKDYEPRIVAVYGPRQYVDRMNKLAAIKKQREVPAVVEFDSSIPF